MEIMHTVAIRGVRSRKGRLNDCRAERSHMRKCPPSPSETSPSEAIEAKEVVCMCTGPREATLRWYPPLSSEAFKAREAVCMFTEPKGAT